MSITTKTAEPTEFAQGERVAWTKTIDDYPASAYTLVYRFRPRAGNGFNVTASADGDDFDAVITAAVSSEIPDSALGEMVWQSWLTEIGVATNTFLHESGTVRVLRGFTASELAAVDLRSPAKIALDSIDAAMIAFSTSDVLEYEISTPAGSRRVKRSARTDLMNLRKHYAELVAREMSAEHSRKTGKFGKTVNVRVYDNG